MVIVGAGLGGLRVAESLRAAGYTEHIVLVGDEDHLPYNRPPLSKEALAGGVQVEDLHFRRKESVDDVEWRLGSAVVASDLAGKTITLADGSVIEFDALVVASGIRPRILPIPGPSLGRHTLRTADDAAGLRDEIAPGTSVVIMGAGFIGCEVAATARKLGADVHV
ncbi:MAG: NAD(P)/FAD-dependent oxidoreductase, partial [Candidatus Nanopelagicales bacterium]|nr:NAD(P)/FAD-dependent oxidoreductase [Candidatus Nanopelagicales bacterium]